MFVDFFYQLRQARIPVTIREFLTLLEALEKGVAQGSVDEFYYLSRAALVKDERLFDTFDLVFENFFKGAMNKTSGLLEEYIPEDWLRGMARELFDEDEIEAMSFEELMDELARRLQEQDGEHHGGNRWIGTGGTSPFGNSGRNPSGVRIGGDGGGKSAAKMWQKRDFRNLKGDVELGTRNMKMALRRLRQFVREGAEEEFDLDATIQSTAHHGGMLDIKMRAERKNKVKVLTMFDVGGSMDSFIRISEELFSAVRTEFKHLEYYYFHNVAAPVPGVLSGCGLAQPGAAGTLDGDAEHPHDLSADGRPDVPADRRRARCGDEAAAPGPSGTGGDTLNW